jgi:hypothetical protein
MFVSVHEAKASLRLTDKSYIIGAAAPNLDFGFCPMYGERIALEYEQDLVP